MEREIPVSRSGFCFCGSVFLAAVVLIIGCGRSPAAPRAPIQMVKVENGRAVPCHCDADDDDDDAAAADDTTTTALPRQPAGVQYVRMTEWQPPESVQRIESEIVPRGDDPPKYIQFPQLKLHRGIGEASRTVPRYWR
jgi:hypothetical protein